MIENSEVRSLVGWIGSIGSYNLCDDKNRHQNIERSKILK